MKKSLLLLTVSMALAGSAAAQNFSTTAVTDQFDTGVRGNESPGTTPRDGSGATAYNGADVTGGPISYINAYAGASAGDPTNGETPVMDVSVLKNADRDTLLSTRTQPVIVPANGLSGASDGNKVLVVSDDGGHNTIVLGDPASTDYFLEIDFYAVDHTATTTQYEALKIGVRTGRDVVVTGDGGSYSVDRVAGYGIIYDYQFQNLKAVKFRDGLGAVADAYGRAGSPTEFDTQYGSTTAVATGWHRLRIEANGSNITYFLDGSQIATANDGTPVANGRIGIQYRAGGGATAPGSANETAGLVDNLKAGPIVTSVDHWNMY